MLFAFVAALLNLSGFKNWIILSFVLGVGTMLSGYSYTSRIHSNAISYLGKLSMPMFAWHWFVATLVNRINQFFSLSTIMKLFLYFGGTMLLSVISYSLVHLIKKRRKRDACAKGF